jgi:hypothetical protein
MKIINKISNCIKKIFSDAEKNPVYVANLISDEYKSTGLSCFYSNELKFRFSGNEKVKFHYPLAFNSKVDFVNDGMPSIRRKSFAALDNIQKYNELKKSLDDLSLLPMEMEQKFLNIIEFYKY